MATRTDHCPSGWAIDDEVFRLREWGTDAVHVLPDTPADELEVGSARGCALRLFDGSGRLSRRHARLTRRTSGWIVEDLGSKNGLRLDGERQPIGLLRPGAELGMGGLTLVAESRRLSELRGFLARLLGYAPERQESVDRALRALRLAALGAAPLSLVGYGDLVPLAQALHRRTLGEERPFIVCDPRRTTLEATVRSSANAWPGREALRAAEGGTLCVRSKRLPRDFAEAFSALSARRARTQLVVCVESAQDGRAFQAMRLKVPQLWTRRPELSRVIEEYAEEAARELSPGLRFAAAERAWIASHSSSSLSEIEKGTRRLLAVRRTRGSVKAAAELLGMSHVSLRAWFLRRRPLGMRLGV